MPLRVEKKREKGKERRKVERVGKRNLLEGLRERAGWGGVMECLEGGW
jgi:hypothetical protein